MNPKITDLFTALGIVLVVFSVMAYLAVSWQTAVYLVLLAIAIRAYTQ